MTAFVLVRSDAGDGGWSLHAPGSTPEQIADGTAPYLASGEASILPNNGEWSRPDGNDYAAAEAAYAVRQPTTAHTAYTPGPWTVHVDKSGGNWDYQIRTVEPHNPAGGIGKHVATVNAYLRLDPDRGRAAAPGNANLPADLDRRPAALAGRFRSRATGLQSRSGS